MQPCSHYSHGDFPASAAYTATAAMEMSQPRPCSMPMPISMPMQPCSHAAIEISPPSQPMQPVHQWRCLSHAHTHAHTHAHAHAAMQSCSHRDFSAFAAYAATAAMEISQLYPMLMSIPYAII